MKKFGWVGLGVILGLGGAVGTAWWYLRDAMK